MGVITLTSDWGTSDYYAGAVKGMIYRHYPEARIIDITHELPKFDSGAAAFMLRNSWPGFPEGSIHLIGVNTEESINEPHTIACYHKQYFIGADNGVFSMIFDGEPEWIIELDIHQEAQGFTFSSRDRFAVAAARIARGDDPKAMGTPRKALNSKMLFKPVIDAEVMKGMVIHVDSYQNLITNIEETTFRDFIRHRPFVIAFRNQRFKVDEIHEAYTDVRPGEIVAVFASNGLLEIAINQGKASSLLGISKSDTVVVSIESRSEPRDTLF